MRSHVSLLLALASPLPLVVACSSGARLPAAAQAEAPATLSPRRDEVASAPEKAATTSAHADAELAKTGAETREAKTAPATRLRMGAKDLFAYIYRTPSQEGLPLGYIRVGAAVPLLGDKPTPGRGCSRGWYAVAPRGFACLDDRTTLDLTDPYYLALAEYAPAKDAVWAYSYAFSNGAPMYSRLPTALEQESAERKLGLRGSFVQLAAWSAGHEELIVDEPIVAVDPIPAIFQGKRTIFGGLRNRDALVWRTIPNGSMLSYARAFEAEGRTWLVSPDLMLVPADRVRKLRRSTFHGVMLGEKAQLPLAWNRTKAPKPTYRRGDDGALVATEGAFPAKSPLPISGTKVTSSSRVFYEVRGQEGVFVAEDDVTISRAATKLPRGVRPGQKWIEVKILPGTLTAYEDLTPVRATLFSPGKGGVPVPGHDPNKYATTNIGIFPIEWKDRTAAMSSEKYGEPKVLWFSDVPHIQYLRAPLAMHVAFWHEDFGNPKSAECVNVSPEDGHWLFNWTGPELPEGWGAMRPGGGNGLSTTVVVTAR